MNFLNIVCSLRDYLRGKWLIAEAGGWVSEEEHQSFKRGMDAVTDYVFSLPDNLKEIALGKRVGIPTLCRDIPDEWLVGRLSEAIHGREVSWRNSPGLNPYDEVFVRYIDSSKGIVSQVWHKIDGKQADMWYASAVDWIKDLNAREGYERFVLDTMRVLPALPPPLPRLPRGLVEVVEDMEYEDFVNQGLRYHRVLKVNKTRFRVEFEMPSKEQQGWRHIDAEDRFGRKLHRILPIDWHHAKEQTDSIRRNAQEYIDTYCRESEEEEEDYCRESEEEDYDYSPVGHAEVIRHRD